MNFSIVIGSGNQKSRRVCKEGEAIEAMRLLRNMLPHRKNTHKEEPTHAEERKNFWPKRGEAITVQHRSIEKVEGMARVVAAKPALSHVDAVYLDGRVRTKSGDVFDVAYVNGSLVTVH